MIAIVLKYQKAWTGQECPERLVVTTGTDKLQASKKIKFEKMAHSFMILISIEANVYKRK